VSVSDAASSSTITASNVHDAVAPAANVEPTNA